MTEGRSHERPSVILFNTKYMCPALNARDTYITRGTYIIGWEFYYSIRGKFNYAACLRYSLGVIPYTDLKAFWKWL